MVGLSVAMPRTTKIRIRSASIRFSTGRESRHDAYRRMSRQCANGGRQDVQLGGMFGPSTESIDGTNALRAPLPTPLPLDVVERADLRLEPRRELCRSHCRSP